MIKIGVPFIFEDDKNAFLKAPVYISEDTALVYRSLPEKMTKVYWRLYENYPPIEWQKEDFGLYFCVPKQFKEYLCKERADAFVVAMLWYAMITGSDIEIESVISEKLAFGIEQLLIPALCKDRKAIRIIGARTSDQVVSCGKVGTGMSCGIDSLYSLKKYSDSNVSDSFRLTHLCYFKMGSIFSPSLSGKKQYGMEEFYSITDDMATEKMENARSVAEEAGLNLVYIQSNLDKDIYRGGFGYTCVYRNCAMVLALQGLFAKYYCSSAGWPEFFGLSLSEGSEHYETLLCEAFSTESLRFIISDYATRIEKTVALADDNIAQRYLDVCYNFNNCGKCVKCYRTLVTLDVLGKIRNFGAVFDIDSFEADRENAYLWLLNAKDGDPNADSTVYAKDIYRLIQKTNFEIPSGAIEEYNKQVEVCRKTMLKRKVRTFASKNKHRILG